MVENYNLELFLFHQGAKTDQITFRMESFQKIHQVSVHSKTGVDGVISLLDDGRKPPFWILFGPLASQNWPNMIQNGIFSEV